MEADNGSRTRRMKQKPSSAVLWLVPCTPAGARVLKDLGSATVPIPKAGIAVGGPVNRGCRWAGRKGRQGSSDGGRVWERRDLATSKTVTYLISLGWYCELRRSGSTVADVEESETCYKSSQMLDCV